MRPAKKLPVGSLRSVRTLRALSIAAFLGALGLSLLGEFGAWQLYGEIASHFRVQYLEASMVCLAAFLCLRAWRWSAAAVACAALNFIAVEPWLLHDAPGVGRRETRLLLSNVNIANTNYAALIAVLGAEKPDLMVVEEATHGWMEALSALQASYPFTRYVPNRYGGGIALLSRFPIEDAKEPSLTFPHLTARIEIGSRSLFLVSIHPPPAKRADLLRERNRQLSAIAQLARRAPSPILVIGDLNTSLWSPYYTAFADQSGLVSTRERFGILPTWPNILPLIPIDHVLASRDVKVLDCRVGPDIGSDHLPLIADFAFAP